MIDLIPSPKSIAWCRRNEPRQRESVRKWSEERVWIYAVGEHAAACKIEKIRSVLARVNLITDQDVGQYFPASDEVALRSAITNTMAKLSTFLPTTSASVRPLRDGGSWKLEFVC